MSRDRFIRESHDQYCAGRWDDCTKNGCQGIAIISEAFDEGALAMRRASARLVREIPDRTKADSTVWRIDSVLADELAAKIEDIEPVLL